MGLRRSEYHSKVMARSLKSHYLLLALGAIVLLSLIVGSLAYYGHRADTSDAQSLAASAFTVKLETELEERAQSLGSISSMLLAHTLSTGDVAGSVGIGKHLLEQRDGQGAVRRRFPG